MIFAARTKLETQILENIDFYSELVIVNPVVVLGFKCSFKIKQAENY
jgi:hypothetical protein